MRYTLLISPRLTAGVFALLSSHLAHASDHSQAPETTLTWLQVHWLSSALAILAATFLLLLLLLHQVHTSYKLKTDELQQRERNYRSLVEYANVIHWRFDFKSQCFTYVSPQIKRILGYEPSLWTTLDSMVKTLHPDDRHIITETCMSESLLGLDHFLEFRVFKADGQIVWLYDTITVNMGKRGPEELIGFMADITDAKKHSIEQERLLKEMAQTRKMRALGQLTGGIAHDFNNILAIILGHCELSLQKSAPDPRNIRVIKAAAERGRDLVNKMLAYNRGDTTHPDPINLEGVIREQAALLRATIPSTIAMHVDIADDLPFVRIDALHVEQIIMNLVINARDAMSSNGTLALRAHRSTHLDAVCSVCFKTITGDWFEISVSDTGGGIASEQIPSLFEPFYTTKSVGNGAGMGLAIVSGILKQCGGHILVESQTGPGSGTTFRVLLPICEHIVAPDKVELPSSDMRAIRRHERILIVDDEPDLGRVMGKLLETTGYTVRVESDSRTVLENAAAISSEFQLVITDQTMPSVSGVELVHALRAHNPHLPMILCTGFSDSINETSAKQLDVHFMSKPVDTQHLFALTHRAIGAAQQTQAAALLPEATSS